MLTISLSPVIIPASPPTMFLPWITSSPEMLTLNTFAFSIEPAMAPTYVTLLPLTSETSIFKFLTTPRWEFSSSSGWVIILPNKPKYLIVSPVSGFSKSVSETILSSLMVIPFPSRSP